MTFPAGTTVTFPVGNGEVNIGIVQAYEDGQYLIGVQGDDTTEDIQVDEADVKEFKIEIQNRGIFETLK
ncbi:hypothetical protein BJX62DRAFT_82099 [Aspergillus germanicus]